MPLPALNEDERNVLKMLVEQHKTIYTALDRETNTKKYIKLYVIHNDNIVNITALVAKVLGGLWHYKSGAIGISSPGMDAGADLMIQFITKLYNDLDTYKEFRHEWL